jgi:hypothetical protein
MLVLSERQAGETWEKIKAIHFQKSNALARKLFIFFHTSKN